MNHGRSSNPLLRRQDRDLLGLHDRWRIPFASQRFGLRSIEAHGQIKGPFGSRKPVGFLVCTWALVLKIKVERPVRTVLERHPATDGKTVQAVSDLKAVLVVECDRPEGVHGRDGRFVEVNRVLVRTVNALRHALDGSKSNSIMNKNLSSAGTPSRRVLVSILAHCLLASTKARNLNLQAESELGLAKNFLAHSFLS